MSLGAWERSPGVLGRGQRARRAGIRASREGVYSRVAETAALGRKEAIGIMGLIEKRLIKEAKDTWLPGEQEEMRAAAGSQVVIDVDWASFETDEPALKHLQHLGVRKISNAFRVICVDDLGKEAVRDQIRRVVVTNAKDATEASVTLEDGTMTLRCAFAKGSEGCMGDLTMARALERML